MAKKSELRLAKKLLELGKKIVEVKRPVAGRARAREWGQATRPAQRRGEKNGKPRERLATEKKRPPGDARPSALEPA